MNRARRFALLLSVVLGAAAVHPATAAEDEIRLGIHPAGQTAGFVELELDAGSNTTVRVDIVNAGSAIRARTYAADAFTLVNGGFGARTEAEPKSGAAAWLGYEAASLELASGEVSTHSVSVNVPPATPPGDYIAALVVQNEEPVAVGSAGGLQQIVRAALAVVIDVPGPRLTALSVGPVEHAFAAGTSVIGFPVGNDGNVRVRPTAAFRLESSAGAPIETVDAALDSFYAGLPGRVEFPLDEPLMAGTYCARLVLSVDSAPVANSGRICFDVGDAPAVASAGPSSAPDPPDQPTATPAVGSFVGPILVVLLVLGLALLLVMFLTRRRRRQSDDSTTR